MPCSANAACECLFVETLHPEEGVCAIEAMMQTLLPALGQRNLLTPECPMVEAQVLTPVCLCPAALSRWRSLRHYAAFA